MKTHKRAGTITKNQIKTNGLITNELMIKNNKCDIIIGIDPGLQNLGIGIIQIEKNGTIITETVAITKKKSKTLYHVHEIAKCLSAYECITIKMRVASTIEERLYYAFEQLSILFENYQPKLIMVENAFVGVNKNSALKLGMARGCIFTAIGKYKLTAHTISPKQIKMEITGKGDAKKEDIPQMFEKILPNWENNTLDSSDALAAAFCGVKLLYEDKTDQG